MTHIAEVVVNGPFKEGLDYLVPSTLNISIGTRIIVPLRNRKAIGFVINLKEKSKFSFKQLKPIISVIDSQIILGESQIKLLTWLARYYHASYYDVLQSMLPNLILKGDLLYKKITYWRLISKQENNLISSNAHKQLKAYNLLKKSANGLSQQALKELKIDTSTLNKLKEKGLALSYQIPQKVGFPNREIITSKPDYTLNEEQQTAITQIQNKFNQHHVFLLEGVTGSGKTEIYIQIIQKLIKENKQALLLVPEIGLTQQLVTRIESRFGIPVITFHSHLSDTERLKSWHLTRQNDAKIIIGTRSSIFLPFQTLGAIFIDEEHDPSYKQQNQLRYHARDTAILMAKSLNIPVILGSATPSLESLHNVDLKKYSKLTLTSRAGNAEKVTPYIIDMRHNAVHSGVSQPLIDKISTHLEKGNQVLLFLNRRGYAPTLLCRTCGHIVKCLKCDAPYTYHINPQRLVCHFCETKKSIVTHCTECQSEDIALLGEGTEQVEEYLSNIFPNYNVIRIDRNSTTTQAKLNESFKQINENQAQIIIGTQMLAKGHHFPNVTLVGIINIDSGLYSHDFRALERTAQLITQVAGRAGRETKKGEVYLQTHTPDHPLITTLLNQGYTAFSEQLKKDRKLAHWPPYSILSLIKAESKDQIKLERAIQNIKDKAQHYCQNEQLIIGPFPAIRYKQQERYRMMLLVQAPNRVLMQQTLYQIEHLINQQKDYNIRFNLDIDPSDMM
ncbi:primosomal protein N' [Thiotrichales bacterium 19S9-12]|nr:primosomal protein N' [Thiotrichales bacterium 19S9-11]MCF6811121.1 primosomal protein N' [Thiotrichales bacterium 19S9-12]